MQVKRILSSVVLLAAELAGPAVAFAGSSGADWIKPVSDGTNELTVAIAGIAGGVIGLGIVGYGVWGAMKQRIELEKIWIYFLAGLLVGVGPAAVTWWITKMQASTGA